MGKRYYEQEAIWGKGIHSYQKQVLETILNIIPNDVSTILDVGCGDGYITNPLSEQYEVTGMDISEEALKYLKCDGVVGDITNIPFEENTFDIVIINDVLEHIEDAQYKKALSELMRVTKKYVIVTVPNEEDIENKSIVCSHCKEIYHINWHQRTYNREKISNLFKDNNIEAHAIFYSGDVTLPPHNPLVEWNHSIEANYEWQGAICPKCNQQHNEVSDMDKKPIYTARQLYWQQVKNRSSNTRSEIMGLYIKGKTNIEINGQYQNTQSTLMKHSIQDISFTNLLQQVADITEGERWAKWQLIANIRLCNEGITVDQVGQKGYLRIYYPALYVGDELIIKANHITEGNLKALAIDAILGQEIELKMVHDANNIFRFKIEKMWNATQFGYQVDLYISEDIILKNIHYSGKYNMLVDFWNVKKGFNIYCIDKTNTIKEYNTICVEVDGEIPILLEEHVKDTATNKQIYKAISEVYNNSITMLHSRIVESNNEIMKLTNSYQQTSVEKEELNKLLNEKEAQREELNKLLNEKEEENIYVRTELSQSEAIRKLVNNRKVNRVLVLSHMFPTEDNVVNGCFVHEQVKALREYEHMDARVISCKPFWLNGINIPNLWRANKTYPNYVAESKWTEYDGVPVLYLPYRVGMPFLPFHVHGWTYTDAIMRVIDTVWKEFKFDVIHAHTGYLDGNAAKKIAERYNVPYVITEHTGPFSILTDKPIVKQRTLNAIKYANKVWAVSDSLRDTIASHYTRLKDKEHIEVLYNGVNMDKFSLSTKKVDFQKEINIMYVGYMEEIKNPLNLLEAFKVVHQQYPQAKLKMVGDGTLYNDLIKKIVELNINEYVTMYGLKTRDEVAELIKDECDIFVLPSKAETFGVVLIEAMACGKPLVATKCGGPQSIIQNEVGRLCENNNIEDLSWTIKEVINEYNTFNSIRIRDSAKENFSHHSIVKRLAEEYQQLL